jgi:hypothetical protein
MLITAREQGQNMAGLTRTGGGPSVISPTAAAARAGGVERKAPVFTPGMSDEEKKELVFHSAIICTLISHQSSCLTMMVNRKKMLQVHPILISISYALCMILQVRMKMIYDLILEIYY